VLHGSSCLGMQLKWQAGASEKLKQCVWPTGGNTHQLGLELCEAANNVRCVSLRMTANMPT
jgi:hypothetical protein